MPCKRTVYDWDNPGKTKKITVDHHSYTYSGQIPCTGSLVCIYCGKFKDEEETEPDE